MLKGKKFDAFALTKHSRGCPCTYRVQSERISRFIDA